MKRALSLTLTALLASPLSTDAIINAESGDPSFHTLAPPFAEAAWRNVGFWGPFTGVAIAPHTFVAATHVGGEVGQRFQYQGRYFTALSSLRAPDGSDLTLWRVAETFPNYAALYEGSAVGCNALLAGRGTQRGAAVFTYSNAPLSPLLRAPTCVECAGWAWGVSDALLRWGMNTLAGDVSRYALTFSAKGCTASLGDSSGACFVLDERDQTWKLAGVISAVWSVGPYAACPNGVEREGAYLNGRWLYSFGEQLGREGASQTFITPIGALRWWIVANCQ